MSFFSNEEDEKGHHKVVLGSQWWLFLVVSIPLTIVIATKLSQRDKG